MKNWELTYEGSRITVENEWNRERLYINDTLHDEGFGLASRSKLIGRLPDGKLVKVTIASGFWSVQCSIFVEENEILRG